MTGTTPKLTPAIPNARVAAVSFPAPPDMVEPQSDAGKNLARLNLNEAPFPPSPRALQAAKDALENCHRYPQHHAKSLAEKIAIKTGIGIDRISFGNGSGEILVACANIALNSGDEAIFPTPTFPTCGKGVQIVGGKIVDVPLLPDGRNDIRAMLDRLNAHTRLFYVCTPNNPTGQVVSEDELAMAADRVPENCLLVVDEAYYEFAHQEGAPDSLKILQKRNGPWVITRSFSKAYALAGLRAGYALCSDVHVRDALWNLRPNFNLNRIAIAAASAAFEDEVYLQNLLNSTISERKKITAELTKKGFDVLPTYANFVTARPPQDGLGALELEVKLKSNGIWVQALPWPDAHGALRITVGTPADNARLLEAI